MSGKCRGTVKEWRKKDNDGSDNDGSDNDGSEMKPAPMCTKPMSRSQRLNAADTDSDDEPAAKPPSKALGKRNISLMTPEQVSAHNAAFEAQNKSAAADATSVNRKAGKAGRFPVSWRHPVESHVPPLATKRVATLQVEIEALHTKFPAFYRDKLRDDMDPKKRARFDEGKLSPEEQKRFEWGVRKAMAYRLYTEGTSKAMTEPELVAYKEELEKEFAWPAAAAAHAKLTGQHKMWHYRPDTDPEEELVPT